MENIYPITEIQAIRDLLLARKETIAVAESVTSGHLQAALSLAEDARRIFQGGITVYNIGQKCRQLNIEPVHALEVNGVSGEIAADMAKHVASLFCSKWAIGITGYAAPVPEKNIRVPFAYFALLGNDKVFDVQKIDPEPGSPLEVQLYYVRNIFSSLLEKMKTAG